MAVVSPAPIAALPPTDGFAPRYRHLLLTLAGLGPTALVQLLPAGASSTPSRRLEGVEALQVTFDPPGQSRVARARHAAHALASPRHSAAWEKGLVSTLRQWGADCVLVVASISSGYFGAVAHYFPTALFAEEETSPWRDHPPNRAAAAFHRLEAVADRRHLRDLARVVVISPAEVGWATDRFGRTDVSVVPYALDLRWWSEGVAAASEVVDVFVLGTFSTGAIEGLDRILDAAKSRWEGSAPAVVLAGPTSPPVSFMSRHRDWVRFIGMVKDPRPWYRAAKIVLVPPFVMRGIKTTILQAWATRCPVVTTHRCAASVDGRDGLDLLAGRAPIDVAGHLLRALDDADLRSRLSENGAERVLAHGPTIVSGIIEQLVNDLTVVAPP